jgi:hypothetical protein
LRLLSRTETRRSAGRRSASPTMPTMMGVIAAPMMAPPRQSSWMKIAAASDEALAMMSVWKEMPELEELDRDSRGAVLT